MTLMVDGAKSTAQAIRSNRPALCALTRRPAGTINIGQSERATTIAVTDPIGRSGRSAPAAPMTIKPAELNLAKSRISPPGSPCLIDPPTRRLSESIELKAARNVFIMSSRSPKARPSAGTIPPGATTCSILSSARRTRATAFAHSRAFIETGDRSIGHST